MDRDDWLNVAALACSLVGLAACLYVVVSYLAAR
jgi:hypothetical protein